MESFMEDALQLAKKANENKEVPVGCLFVWNSQILATGSNLVNETKNATRHAEFICIDQVLDHCRREGLDYRAVFGEVSVVVTVEPCIMCAAALINLGVREVIFGCKNDRFGGQTVVDVFGLLRSAIPVKGGVRAAEAMDLLKEFYKGENPSAPVAKKKRVINQ
jgi:tRNA-specific adenosine deaminase 2